MKRLTRKIIHTGPVFDVWSETWRDPEGRKIVRESVAHPGAVVILPFVRADRVLMLRQFRTAVGSWVLEVPAGTLEEGETPLRCARRELIEETGFAARKWQKLGRIFSTPGFCTEVMHLYRAWDLTPRHAEADADEIISVREMSLRDVRAGARTGRIRDAKSLAVLYLDSLAR